MKSKSRRISRHRCKEGFTVTELLVALAVFALMVTVGIPAFKATLERWEVNGAVRTVTAAFSEARYQSVKKNRAVKVRIGSRWPVRLELKENNAWKVFKTFRPEGGNTRVSANAAPVFSPSGFASPLCSVRILSERYTYVITLAMGGRLKVEQR